MVQLFILLFIAFLIAFLGAVLVWWRLGTDRRRQKIERMLTNVDPSKAIVTTTVLIETPRGKNKRQAGQSGIQPEIGGGGQPQGSKSVRSGLLLTIGMAFAGLLAGSSLSGTLGPSALVLGALAGGALPYLYRSHKRKARMNAIEDQFPDALDFLSRSLRAGNALSISLEMLAAEASEPLKSEFLKVTREQALGAPLENALEGLAIRVPLMEVRFFVCAVLLQRETGGNLGEVLSRLAMSVRERLRLRGHVKAASAQGRLTSGVLTIMPIAVFMLLKVISPTYLDGMTSDPLGKMLLTGAVVMQVLAYACMKKITNIKV